MNKQTIQIKAFPIRLGQFLKLTCTVQDGMEAKMLIHSGEVIVNGHIEKRRGKQLTDGDSVQIGTDLFFTLEKSS